MTAAGRTDGGAQNNEGIPNAAGQWGADGWPFVD